MTWTGFFRETAERRTCHSLFAWCKWFVIPSTCPSRTKSKVQQNVCPFVGVMWCGISPLQVNYPPGFKAGKHVAQLVRSSETHRLWLECYIWKRWRHDPAPLRNAFFYRTGVPGRGPRNGLFRSGHGDVGSGCDVLLSPVRSCSIFSRQSLWALPDDSRGTSGDSTQAPYFTGRQVSFERVRNVE